jgi:hypothetical protein
MRSKGLAATGTALILGSYYIIGQSVYESLRHTQPLGSNSDLEALVATATMLAGVTVGLYGMLDKNATRAEQHNRSTSGTRTEHGAPPSQQKRRTTEYLDPKSVGRYLPPHYASLSQQQTDTNEQ